MEAATPSPRRWTWPRLAAVTLARSVLVGLLGLAAWGALPAVVGWHPTTVSSGSMLPRLHVGDVAVSRPLAAHVPTLGSVLLFHDPDHPGRLRMHRFVRIDDAGLLVTRGDANGSDDSTPVALGTVVGIGTLRVPWVALPVVWVRQGQWLFLALVAACLALLLAVAASGRDRTFDDDPDKPDDPAGPRTTESGPAESAPGTPATSPSPDVLARRGSPRRRGATLVVALVLSALVADPAGAGFSSRTSTTVSLATSPASTCASTVAALNPYFYYRMDETSATATAATDSSGNARTGVYSTAGRTPTTDRPCANDSGGSMTFDGSRGSLASPGLPNGMPTVLTLAVWFRTTTQTGGKLIGFGSGQTGSSGTYDRHIYLANSGRVYFGVYANAVKTVSSSKAYNDGAWHLAVASLSSAGLRLYVDGALVASDTSTTTGEPGTSAYVRVAYDNLSNWDATPTSFFFAGTLDDATYFPSALTASQVQALYAAAAR
ncbi:LamG-like jellyroll fold domain-containing protein [Microlunatus antarcticus]|uniref:Concanavalin A-like lectin/glucanases superfamily protein n=1 Tax=Microlunatus antarcticus TaxID=53388 RepID=A0A7W5JU12_9ACTN|nr:hypothetical protein [Microlunatus antarcticus]